MKSTTQLRFFLMLSVTLAASLGPPVAAWDYEPAMAGSQPAWSVEGEWTDTCSCRIPCPCWIKGMPTLGHCSEMFYFHVTKGHYGNVRLDGIDVVQIASSAQGKPTSESRRDRDYQISNLYVSKTLSSHQVAAAEAIFKRLAFSGSMARKHATKRVALHTERGPDFTKVEIPGILHAVVRMRKVMEGKPEPFPYPTKGLPALVGPAIQGESVAFEFHDDGFSWKYSGRQGTFAHFSYSSDRGPMPWESKN